MSGLMGIPGSGLKPPHRRFRSHRARPLPECYQVQTQSLCDQQSEHMSDVANRIIGFASSALQALRSLWSPGNSQGRLQASIRQAELEGLQFAFYARLTAIIVVSVWLIWLVPWPRDLYYGAYAFGFFVLGLHPVPIAAPSSWRGDQAWLHSARRGFGDGRDPGPAPSHSRHRMAHPDPAARPGIPLRSPSPRRGRPHLFAETGALDGGVDPRHLVDRGLHDLLPAGHAAVQRCCCGRGI